MLDPIPQQEAGDQKGQSGADAGGERHDHRAPEKSEQGPGGQGQYDCTGQGQAGDQNVEKRKQQPDQDRCGLAPLLKLRLPLFQLFQRQPLVQIQ
ncbi:hypothetical protein [Microbulbifer taiwanensis]|uniref:hypothetical protein n=1 Tax=Microbulbifer taiwanensis TaxID=986746 RepID=UPI0036123872